MKTLSSVGIAILTGVSIMLGQNALSTGSAQESPSERAARMKWWNEARFGLFIHWGLYSIPAGEWNGVTTYGEWIREQAHIPLDVYDSLVSRFDPVKFNARQWVQAAKQAGMKYIVITSKHHDGFCLFDSKYTDFDVMATPFRRDILKELAAACAKEGIRLCFYHSIMDWHHPDYLPRRGWETTRPVQGADFDRYVEHMKSQLRELLSNYGKIGVLWFDGEWEETWNDSRGMDLYRYVRSLQPDIIINNRVGASREGMAGMTVEGGFGGDFGTPEQEIPATGLPGSYWETCMTMNDHWGYNSRDDNWKSAEDLIRKLSDIASKGGNFLLNVGPTSEGAFPPASIERLNAIGQWMKVNGEAIYGTSASPFSKLDWGRCTQKSVDGGTRLYLHVFRWPGSGKLLIPDITNTPRRAYLLSDSSRTPLPVALVRDTIVIEVPPLAPDSVNTVIALDLDGRPDVKNSPTITAEHTFFVDQLDINISSDRENVELRYSLDGTAPTINSPLVTGPIQLTSTAVVTARCFRKGEAVSLPATATFKKVKPWPAVGVKPGKHGVRYAYYEGDWDWLPDFGTLKPVTVGTLPNFSLAPRSRADHYGFTFDGLIQLPEDGIYEFFTNSDDGSRLFIDDSLIVDNDGTHGMVQKSGAAPLAAGLHSIRVLYFEKAGEDRLEVSWRAKAGQKLVTADELLFLSR